MRFTPVKNSWKDLKFVRVWAFIGYLLVFFTVYICLSPNPPDTSSVQFGDKIVHMGGYLCLFLWFAQIYKRKYHYLPVVGLTLLGIFIECAQGMTEYRSFELLDMLANTSGVLFGWIIASTSIANVLMKVELLLTPRSI